MFSNGPGDLGSIPGHVVPKTLKLVLDTSLLNTQQYNVRIKGKVEQSREWIAHFPTPQCSSYWKEAFWSPSITIANFTFTYFNLALKFYLITMVLVGWLVGCLWLLINSLRLINVKFCLYIYIYIYIYIYSLIAMYRQTVSLYHNSSVWLDTQDPSSWDRNPSKFTLDLVSYYSASSDARQLVNYNA